MARYAGASAVIAHVVRSMVELGETGLGSFLMARRDGQRPSPPPGGGLHWFSADEAALVSALANLIVPSDDTGPGAAQMLNRSAAEALDALVAGSERRQALYAHGLRDLNRLAEAKYGSAFVQLQPEKQRDLLHSVDRRHQRSPASPSVMSKMQTRVVALYQKWTRPAVAFFPLLVDDVMRVFYTDRVSWAWLGYDGPPMPEGYRDPLDRRAPGPTDPDRVGSAAS